MHFYFSIPRFLKIPGKLKLVINGKIILIHINTYIYIYGRCIYVQYLTYMLVTFLLLTAVTLSLLAIVYLDALCLSSDYQDASVLFCHPTDRVAKTDNNCHIFDQSLSISSKMHNLLGLFNNYWKSVPRTVFQKFPWILGWLISASNYEHQQSKRKKETSQQIVTG